MKIHTHTPTLCLELSEKEAQWMLRIARHLQKSQWLIEGNYGDVLVEALESVGVKA